MHEKIEKEVHVEEEGLEITRKKLDDPDESEAAWAARNFETYQTTIASAKLKAREHGEILLPWIEQHRIALVAETNDNTGSHKDELAVQDDASQSSLAPNWRKRKMNRRSILDPVQSGVLRSTFQRRSLRLQQFTTLQHVENAFAKPASPSRVIPQAPQLPHLPQKPKSVLNKPRPTKDIYVTPFRPSKVAKATENGAKTKQHTNKIINENGTSRSSRGSGRRKPRKPVQEAEFLRRKSPPQLQQSHLKMKSGREYRRPERYGFLSNR